LETRILSSFSSVGFSCLLDQVYIPLDMVISLSSWKSIRVLNKPENLWTLLPLFLSLANLMILKSPPIRIGSEFLE
jgi:hypothetical protein